MIHSGNLLRKFFGVAAVAAATVIATALTAAPASAMYVPPTGPSAPPGSHLPPGDLVHMYTVDVTDQKQPNTYTCVPTSGDMSLKTILGSSAPSEATLATKMKTTTAGTYWTTAGPALDSYVASKGLEYEPFQTASTADLQSDLIADISAGYAPMLPAWGGLLPWDSMYDGKANYGHAIVASAVTTNGDVWIDDPWDGKDHEETVAALRTQLQSDLIYEIVQAPSSASSAASTVPQAVTATPGSVAAVMR